MTALFKKLNLKDQPRIVVLNAPASFDAALTQLVGVTVHSALRVGRDETFALAFVITQDVLNRLSEALAACMPGDPVLWIAYPKKSSKRYRCEFDRDSGWHALGAAGFEPVRMVAIDQDWSALRFRRSAFIRRTTAAPRG